MYKYWSPKQHLSIIEEHECLKPVITAFTHYVWIVCVGTVFVPAAVVWSIDFSTTVQQSAAHLSMRVFGWQQQRREPVLWDKQTLYTLDMPETILWKSTHTHVTRVRGPRHEVCQVSVWWEKSQIHVKKEWMSPKWISQQVNRKAKSCSTCRAVQLLGKSPKWYIYSSKWMGWLSRVYCPELGDWGSISCNIDIPQIFTMIDRS